MIVVKILDYLIENNRMESMEQPADLVQQLEQIGLKPKEAQVYLALLSLESSTAYEIAQHCEVKKPTVYVILEDLRQKGLVLKVPHAKKALFAAHDLGEYLAEQRGKLNSVQSMLPRLMSLGGAGKPKVYFYNGIRGFAEAQDYRLDSMQGKTFHSFYGGSEEADPKVRELFRRWTPAAVNAGVSFKIVMPKVDIGDFPDFKKYAQEGEHVQVKQVIEYDQANHLSIEIADAFVRITDSKNIVATIIDDKATADSMLRSIFDIVWASGK
jgi:sugar-specific transcriptional regulator TrmB